MFKKIGTFIFKNLVNFIKLMWKLLKGLFNFATKWIPRFIKRTFTFLKYLSIKAKKTGPITFGIYLLLNIGMTKYWDLLLGNVEVGGQEITAFVPSGLINYPALFFTTHIFWTQTRFLVKTQNQILQFFTKHINVVKFFFTTLLGLPNSNLFTSRMPFKRRLILLGRYIKANGKKLFIRLLIFIFIFKFFLKFIYDDILYEGTPDLKDLLLFPIVIIRLFLQLIF